MKIFYTQNPLAIQVYLDKKDRRILELNIEKEDLEELIIDAVVSLEDGKTKEAIDALNIYSNREDKDIENYFKLIFYKANALEQELLGSHAGDCTAIPTSCMKCHAEHLAEVKTIEYLGKSIFSKIYNVFMKPGVTTCSDAIRWLEENPPKVPDGEPQHSIENWNQTHKAAIEYLTKYQEKLKEYRRLTPVK